MALFYMRFNSQKIRELAASRKSLGVKEMLHAAGVSPTAYYSLQRKDSVLPKSIHRIASFLGVTPSDLLVDDQALVRQMRALQSEADRIVASHPALSREDIIHTQLLLQEPPLERLNRALLRGRAGNLC